MMKWLRSPTNLTWGDLFAVFLIMEVFDSFGLLAAIVAIVVSTFVLDCLDIRKVNRD